MKILYKHRTRGQAVESVHINGMTDGFRKLGHDIDLSSPPFVQVGSSHQTVKNKLLEYISLRTPTIFYEFIALLYNAISYRNAQQLLRKNTYDFMYERYAFFDFSTIFLKKRYRIPVLLEVNGSVNRKDPNHGRKLTMKNLACYLEKRLLGVADIIIVVSTSLKKSLAEIGIDSNRILVLPNAIDPKEFRIGISGKNVKQKYGLEGKKIIGFVGSLTYWHGLDFLLTCMAEKLTLCKDIHLLLVGDGHERKKIEKIISDLALDEHVTITGRISHSKVPYFIAAMDIGVMPNSNDFGSPMKIFEYMAMGKPVVSARYGPIEEVIEDGKTGLLFKPLSQEQLIEKIFLLIRNYDLRKKIGEEGYYKVLKENTWNKNAERILKAYNKMKEAKLLYLNSRDR